MVTLQRAREILGNKSKDLSDEQVSKILKMMYFLCSRVVEQVVNSQNKYNKGYGK